MTPPVWNYIQTWRFPLIDPKSIDTAANSVVEGSLNDRVKLRQ